MIRSLAFDSVRLLLRWRGALLVLLAGVLVGCFVRATGEAGGSRFLGLEQRGMTLETLASTLFLLAVTFGLVAGLVLGAEDRRSGFFAELAVRRGRRVSYLGGRLAGLMLSALLAESLLLLGSLPIAGLTASDLPELRERLRPETVFLGEQELADGEFGQIRQGSPGRFSFEAGCDPIATLRLRPKVVLGAAESFSGHLDLSVTLVTEDGRRDTQEILSLRPLRELPIRFERDGSGRPFVLEVEPLTSSFLLEVDRDSLTSVGGKVSVARDSVLGLILILAAAGVAAGIGLLFAIGLSPGPAAFAASFLVLIGLGRAAVLDIVAGLGRPMIAPGEAAPWYSGWLASSLGFLVRLIPDLDRFNPAERLAAGDALPVENFLAVLAVAVSTLAALLALTLLVIPLKER